MALTSQEQLELEALRSSADTLPPSRQARLAQLESKETIGGSPEGSAKVAELSPTMGMLTADKPQSFTPTGAFMQAELEKKPKEQATVVTTTGTGAASGTGTDKTTAEKPMDIASAMNELAGKMATLPKDIQDLKEFKDGTQTINRALEQLNNGYQMDQQSAKDKTEKAKNRAEWASIASMLAKNIVGYAAALHGVDPNAMAYQTTDWEKRIQGLNAELDMNLGNLRDNMKMKVEQKLGEKKDIQDKMGETFKSKMEALRTQGEGSMAKYKGQLQASEAEKDRQARELERQQAAEARARETVTVKPEDVDRVITNVGKAKNFDEAAKMASSFGVDEATIAAAKKAGSGSWLPFDGSETEALRILGEGVRKAAAGRGGRVSSTTSTPTGAALPAGQPSAPVVQSGTVPMFKDGKQYNIPADKVEAAKNKGYTLQ